MISAFFRESIAYKHVNNQTTPDMGNILVMASLVLETLLEFDSYTSTFEGREWAESACLDQLSAWRSYGWYLHDASSQIE